MSYFLENILKTVCPKTKYYKNFVERFDLGYKEFYESHQQTWRTKLKCPSWGGGRGGDKRKDVMFI